MKKLSIIFVVVLILALVPIFQPTPILAVNVTFNTSNSDGFIERVVDASLYAYSMAWANTTGAVQDLPAPYDSSYVGVSYYGATVYWYVDRAFLYFDTSSIPTDAIIQNATLGLYGKLDYTNQDSEITVQQGTSSTYPHDPMVTGDFWKDYYTGNGGTLSTSGWNTSGYNLLTLNSDGKSWINKGGQTKFCLRSSRDINGTQPTDLGYVTFWKSDAVGAPPNSKPYLNVQYTIKPSVATLPASSITYNSARINGNITDDGEDTCEARFRWAKVGDVRDDWLTGWSYRKQLNITGSSGAGTNYQVKYTVYNGTGTDSAGVVYLNGKCSSFPNDIRFTDNDGETLLDHWYETNVGSDSTYRVFWVEVADDLGSNKTIDIYYGKAAESSASNGDNTFIFFDDFTGSFPGAKWAGTTAAGSVAGGILNVTGDGTWRTFYSTTTTGAATCALRMRTSVANLETALGFQNGATNTHKAVFYNDASHATNALSMDGTTQSVVACTWTKTSYRLFDVTVVGATNSKYFDNGALAVSKTTNPPNSTALTVLFGSKEAGLNALCDWVLLRKYVATEPVVGTPSEEEDPWNWAYTDWRNSLATGDTFYEDLVGLDSATEYAYQAQARNDAGTTDWTVSEYFTTCPAAPTNVSASDGEYTDKVVINWTKSTNATGYKIYRDAVLVDTLGDVATYNDTGADAGIITPGTASATDGVYTDKVTLLLSGESVGNGTAHNYTVKAYNDSGDSPASSPDSGYRSVGALIYQWMVSSGDGDSDYSNIGGATTDPYDYTGAPAGTITPGMADSSDGDSPLHTILTLWGDSVADGAGRYYKCSLSATGAADQNSTSDRGYRTTGPLTYQWLVSAGDSDDNYSNLAGATSATHNDTAAPAPTINGGNAAASDGTSTTYVTLNLTNHNATEGDGRYYLCTSSATGTADQNSTSNRGYRGTTSLVLQWLISAADSDADYSGIAGGTTNPYNDTGGATAPDGRYYKCMVNMTGATSQNSTPDRGYIVAIVPPTVIASAATGITAIGATLHGDITDTGWENPSTRGFEWGTASGNYTDNWTEVGSFSTGAFDHAISGLGPATQYFWRAFAINSAGQGNSSELNFTTLLLPGPPLNFTITQTGPNSISINWTLGESANGTEIRVSTSQYPGAITEGYLTYNGTEMGINIDGLSLNTTVYYYRAWSWNTYGYSEDYAEAQIGSAPAPGGTTIPEIAPGLILAVGLSGFALWKRGWIRILLALSVVTWGAFAMSYDIKIAAPLIAIGTILFFMGILPFIEHKGEEVA